MVRRVEPDDWQAYREVRLAALRDAPTAFGSTYEQARELPEAEWRRRLGSGVGFLVYAPDGRPIGIAGGYVNPENGLPGLLAMWVGPSARGQGVAAELVEAVAGWAKGTGADRIQLWVTETNDTARRLYERLGFTYNGEQCRLPSHPDLIQLRMERPF
jgi:GNAT superfamily N-acetyltransferase